MLEDPRYAATIWFLSGIYPTKPPAFVRLYSIHVMSVKLIPLELPQLQASTQTFGQYAKEENWTKYFDNLRS